MKRKIGLLLAVMMSFSLIAATAVSAEESYEEYLNNLLAEIYAQTGETLPSYSLPSYSQPVSGDLRLGSKGSAVQELQSMLAQVGYYQGTIDGDFGSYTDAAVRRFQQDHGLYVDGVVGNQTMNYLKQLVGSGAVSEPAAQEPASSTPVVSGDLRRGSTGESVRQMQSMLAQAGYYKGTVDGDFGGVTEAAVRQFQQAQGLYVDGVVGNQTMTRLRQLAGSGTASQPSAQGSSSTSGTANPASTASTSSTGSALNTNQSLRSGSSGAAVKQMQSMLDRLGYSTGGADGIFGSYTATAVRRFQQDNGLYVDGVAGPQTLTKLNQLAGTGQSSSGAGNSSSNAGSSSSTTGDSTSLFQLGDISPEVYNIQSKLQTLGYDAPLDAVFGQSTIEAIKEFQRVNGLHVDGVYGPQTAAKLENSPVAANGTAEIGMTSNTIASHVKGIISAATNDSMTQSQKLYAVFNYIANRNNYGYSMRVPPYLGMDWPEVYANDMITNRKSDCRGTAALFGYAARMLGYNAYWCSTDGHGWVDIDGLIYDPMFTNSSYHTEVYGWTYEQGISSDLAGYENVSDQAGTFRYIQVPLLQ